MMGIIRKAQWWLQRRRKEAQLREELQFHLAAEAEEREGRGVPATEAARAARRDLGNQALLTEDARALWSWTLLEQLVQDIRYGLRGMAKNPLFTALAAVSLALGIGANTAIYSFMDSIMLRALPISDPSSLIVVKWRSDLIKGREFVMHSVDGRTYDDPSGVTAGIFPYPAFERLQQVSSPVLASLFAHKDAGPVNVIVRGEADIAAAECVSGGFFGGLSIVPFAGRLIDERDDRANAEPVAVLSAGYGRRRFGDAANAVGQSILINNVAFTVIGVAPPEFFGVDPARAPQVYLPLGTGLQFQSDHARLLTDPNYYWLDVMGRLKRGIGRDQAQAALAGPFNEWVAATATDDAERANLPQLRLEEGAAGLDTLRREYSKPLYLLLTMVGLILAIACANTANLLLARSAARTREMAVRLSLGAGRWRVVRQLLTESVMLAALSGALGVLVGFAGMRILTALLANGAEGFTLHAELNWRVLLATLALSVFCGILFGLAPALQATRPALMPQLRDRSVHGAGSRFRVWSLRFTLTQGLVVAQIATSLVLLVAAGLFVRTLSNLHSVALGFNRDNVLLFDVNAPNAGYAPARAAEFYADLRRRLTDVPGVQDATLSHASLIRAGRAHPINIDGHLVRGARVLWAGPRFLSTMQVPLVRGRDIADTDRPGTPPVAVISELFAKANFGDADPIGRRIQVGGSLATRKVPMTLEVVGIAANVRYGGLRRDVPAVIYVPYAQVPSDQLQQMTYAVRTSGDPLRMAATVRQVVREADSRVPITNLKTQAADIDQTINQEIVFARLCTAFAILALTIASVGLYATMAYSAARRTGEIGLRLALGAGRGTVIRMMLRDVGVLAAVGLTIGGIVALTSSRALESFLFNVKPNDPRAIASAAAILIAAALAAGYGPAWRASRVDPLTALRHE
jgi:predicted permease